MRIYKYMRALNSAQSNPTECKISQRLISLIQGAQVYFSHPASFNDPLECTIPYEFIQRGKRRAPDAVLIKEILEAQHGAQFLDSERGIRINEALPFGIPVENCIVSCFSKSENNPLMWAHYADNHNGICLTFDFPNDFANQIGWSQSAIFNFEEWKLSFKYGNVKYRNVRKPLCFYEGIARHDYTLDDAIFTKPTCWRYEKEFRFVLFFPFGGVRAFSPSADVSDMYFSFPRSWLREITFGIRLPSKTCNQIIRYCTEAGYSDIAFQKACLLNRSFNIGHIPYSQDDFK